MTSRPNIMLLVAEDAGRHQGCYGYPVAKTPHIDSLAAEGARYTNGFSTAPVCAPSRSALVTSHHAFSMGSHHMRSTLLAPPRLFTQELRDAGYYVNWANKTDFNFTPPADFADDTHVWFDDLAEGRLPEQPWLLYHNFSVTHESSMWRDDRLQADWQQNSLQARRETTPVDPREVEVPAYVPDTPGVRANLAHYFETLAAQDREIGRALQALEQSGQADQTVVLYLSDHGRGLPREKRWCYDAGIHLPLIIRWPGHLKPGSVQEELVSWVDLAPTLLSIAGVPIPETYQGRAFLGEQASPHPREHCLAGRDRMDEAFDRVRVLRDQRWLYIRNDFPELPYAQRISFMETIDAMEDLRAGRRAGTLTDAQALFMAESKPPEELYDCATDPDNLHNLAENPEHADRLAKMRSTLASELERLGDLATEPESALIERGLVADERADYRDRIAPLPEEDQLGPPQTLMEMEEALAWRESRREHESRAGRKP